VRAAAWHISMQPEPEASQRETGSPPRVRLSVSAATVPGSAALPFVISTGAQRSGEICGPFLEMFFTTSLGRKSGGAQWSDLPFAVLSPCPSLQIYSAEATDIGILPKSNLLQIQVSQARRRRTGSAGNFGALRGIRAMEGNSQTPRRI
jgi:hypothetical protein